MYKVNVIIEHPVRHLDMTFSYLSSTSLKKGIRVHVPFGRQQLVGYVQEVIYTPLSEQELCEQSGLTYRYITDVIDDLPILTPELEQLAVYLSKVTFSPLVSCLKTMLPPALKPSSHAKITKKILKTIYFNCFPDNLSDKQRAYLVHLQEKGSERLKESTVSRSMLETLIKKGAIRIEDKEIFRDVETADLATSMPTLNTLQKNVLHQLFNADKAKPFLLYGITGSGKTEVYLQAASKMLKMGRQVLMLVPEISLTPKMVAMFRSRFHEDVAILHSRLADGQRYDEYRRILNGQAKIVVGARSAVFAPLANIGLIILDEEHDASYKQNNNPRYHTRDMALWRAKYHQAILLFGSASPSIESYARAKKGSYHLLKMSERATLSALPKCQIVDMAKEARNGNLSLFSEAFTEGFKSCLERNEQALILVNRRGYATYLLCKSCGYVPQCPHCDVTLTYHKKENVLKCHYCGYETPYHPGCPSCGEKMMSYRGPGTEQMEETISKTFPQAQIIRYDMDTTRGKSAHEKLLSSFEKHEGNVLLGTQMIAKGLDFPDVTFVGVLDGDSALNLPDYRSAERTFQLLLQVAGRAGRHHLPGKVVIQTYNPYHYAIVSAANQDYEAFYEEEIKSRRQAGYPPYCYLLSILFSGKKEEDVKLCANQLAHYLHQSELQIKVLGPAPAVIPKINQLYRYRLLIKYKQSLHLFEKIREAIANYHGQVKIEVDVNPYTQL